MLFFSAILGAIVRDLTEETCGRVSDILIRIGEDREQEFPPLLGIVMKDKKTKEEVFLPMEVIETWGPNEAEVDRKIEEAVKEIPQGERIVYLKKSVLDKQIVDLEGMRVVRVNDLQFGRVNEIMSLIAIDISTRGILRRLGIQGDILDNIFKSNFLEWHNIQLTDNKLHLAKGAKDLIKLHPADIANIIEKMNLRQGRTLLESLDQAVAARVLEEIQPDIKKLLVKSLGPERTANLMNKMSVDELVDLIQLLPGRESREILKKLPVNAKKENIKKILEYDEDTAGGLMTTEYITAMPNMTVGDVVEKIRKLSHMHHSILFIYIINKEGKFLGVVSIRNLIISNRNKQMKEIMRKEKRAQGVKEHDEITQVANHMTKYNLLSVAVLNKKKHLVGVVTVDDIMRRFVPNA